jgi:hypothetical protein
MGKKFQSDFLIASPSMASGAARLLDWYGTFDEYNSCETPQEADALAASADWHLAGDDLSNAMSEYKEKHLSK